MASVKMGVGRAALGVVFAASLVATTGGTAHAVAGESSAYGAKATLGSLVNVPETVKSAYPGGPPSANLATLALGGIGSINALNTTAFGNVGTGTTQATARTAAATVDLGVGTVRADAITSSCKADSGEEANGASTLTNGGITTPTGVGNVTFPANPAPNTQVALPGGLGTVVLNEQILHPDDSVTVNAIHVNVTTGPLTGDLVIASSSCKTGRPEQGAILNYAVDENGDPLGGVAFEIAGYNGNPSCTTNDDLGLCQIDNLPPGRYEVCVTDVPDGYSLPKPRCKDVVVDGGGVEARFVIPEENGKKGENGKKRD